MAKTLTAEEAVERARRVQDDRITAIRGLAEARGEVEQVRDETARELAELQASIAQRIGDVERSDVKAYNAALSAGWTADELRKIGFGEPEKKARTRRRAARKPVTSRAAANTTRSVDSAPSGEARRETRGDDS